MFDSKKYILSYSLHTFPTFSSSHLRQATDFFILHSIYVRKKVVLKACVSTAHTLERACHQRACQKGVHQSILDKSVCARYKYATMRAC